MRQFILTFVSVVTAFEASANYNHKKHATTLQQLLPAYV